MLLSFLVLAAQVQTQPPALPPITVRGATDQALTAPVSTTRIDLASQPINGKPLLGLDEALIIVPGVVAQSRRNAAQDLRVSVRGFGARSSFGIRGLNVLLDGVPLTTPDGQSQLDTVELERVTSLQVLRGPASSAYGNAAGGVIALSSTQAGSPLARALALQTNSIGDYKLFASTAIGDTALVAASYEAIDGARAHSRSTHRRFNGRWQPTVGGWRADINVRATASPLAQDPGGVTLADARANRQSARDANVRFDAGETVTQYDVSLRANHDTQGWQLTVFGSDRDFANRLPFTGGGAVDLQRRFYGGSVERRWLFNQPELSLTLGGEWADQRDDRQRFDNLQGQRGDRTLAQRETFSSKAVFAYASAPIASTWRFDAGARYDQLDIRVRDRLLEDGDDGGDREFDEATVSAGLSWQTTDSLTTWLRSAQSFQAPTTTELANPDGGGFNPNLAPQQATSYELGARFQRDRLTVEGAIYRVDGDNELLSFERDDQPGRTFFRNGGESTRDGVETSLRWRDHWGYLQWAASLFDHRLDRAGTPRIAGIPKHTMAVEAGWRLTSDWTLAATARRQGETPLNDNNSDQADAYTTFDLRLSRDLDLGRGRRGLLTLGIENLNDRFYADNLRINAFGRRYYEPAPGREAYAKLQVFWR